MKILYADDNHTNCHLINQLMMASGHNCSTVNNGHDALQKLRGENFDVVLSDILMPQMDGFQLCRELRHDPKLADMPFVFYTATYTDPQDRNFALSLGADEFLVKPLDNQQLVLALERAVKRGENAAPAAGASQPDFYELYSERLVQRLEHKLLELAEKNSQLEQQAKRRELAEQQRKEALSLFKATFDSTADGLLAVMDDRIVALNSPFLSQWNFVNEDQVPDTWPSLLEKFREALIWPKNAESLEESTILGPSSQPVELELKKGKILAVSRTPLPMDDVGVALMFCFRDITQERALQATRRDLQRQISQSQKMESLGVMAASIAHDFNNLLTIMLGSVDVLEETIPTLENVSELQEPIGNLRTATDRSVELVARILRFSRSQSQGKHLALLGPTVRDGAQLLSLLVPPTMQLHIAVSPTDRKVLLDPIEIQQIVLNLGANAVAAMNPGGKLTVEVGPQSRGKTNGVTLRVWDTGEGIEPSAVDHIFEPFFTTKPEGQGTGLGLATVQRIADAHHAAIEVSSAVGKGTSISVFFPESNSEHSAEEKTAPNSGKLLLIERDTTGRQRTQQVLDKYGYNVDVAVSERGGVQRIETSARLYSVVVIDDLAGAEAGASELSRVIAAVAPSLPIVVLAGPSAELETTFSRSAIHDNVLLKPWRETDLVTAIERAVHKSLDNA